MLEDMSFLMKQANALRVTLQKLEQQAVKATYATVAAYDNLCARIGGNLDGAE